MFLLPLREINLLGVFVTPASVLLLVALAPWIVFRWLAARIDLNRYVWNRPLVEVLFYLLMYAAGILTLRRG